LLVNYFLKKFSRDQQRPPKSISPGVIKALEHYHWPGNVRELENVIQRALVVAKGEAILPADLPPEINGHRPSVTPGAQPITGGSSDLDSLAHELFRWARQDSKRKVIPAVERELIIQALKETNGNQVQAARLLGITRATLRKRVEKFKIQREVSIT
jgi:two-component system nitrogen regulation response regulator GlnG